MEDESHRDTPDGPPAPPAGAAPLAAVSPEPRVSYWSAGARSAQAEATGAVPASWGAGTGSGGPGGGRRWIAVAVVAAVVGGAVGAAVAEALGTGSGPAGVAVTNGAPGPALSGGASIPAIVQKVLPQVVAVDAQGPSPGAPGGVAEDQGSGMIISTDGEVLTNNHVIAGATHITVTLYGQTNALTAALVGADPSNDMALLRIQSPPQGLQAVTFGDSRKLQVGDAVIAIGNALGLSAGTPTVTSGIVSALGRSVQAADTGSGSTENLTNLIQTDAAINSGNSGGPLVDSSGAVVAMDTAVASTTGTNAPAQNIGFAIPSATIEGLLPKLRAGGTKGATKAYLGVEVVDETAQLRQAYGFVPSSGAVVVTVLPGSPAAAAGIEQGDVIVAFDGHAVTSAQDLTNDVQALASGRKVTVTLYRGAQRLSITATLTSAPAA